MAKNTLIKGFWSDGLGNNQDLQLDLLNLVSDKDIYALASLPSRESKTRKVRTSRAHELESSKKDNLLSFQYSGNLDPDKNFEKFIVSTSNQNAKNAVSEFLKEANKDFHMLYLMGTSGVGKSHLLHAIGNELMTNRQSFYLSSAIQAFSEESSISVLKKYSHILIDDLEDLESSPDRQKILCELLDLAMAKKLKIIMTGSKSVSSIKGLEVRLVQKLKAAISFEIKAMDSVLAKKYIQKIINDLGPSEFSLSQKHFDSLLRQRPLNSYVIAGELSKLSSVSKFHLDGCANEDVGSGEDFAQESDQDSFIDYEKKILEEIIDHLAAEYSIEREKILSNRREKEFSEARHMGMYLFKEKLGLSYNQIGKFFAKDHSTVIYAVDKIRRKIRTERGIRERNVLMRIQ